jgi:putative transposase
MPKRSKIESDSNFHFVTFAVFKHIPVFRSPLFAEEFIKNLRFYSDRGDFKLHAFVIMPDHVHLLLEMNPNKNLSALIRDIKKYFSFHAKNSLFHKSRFDMESFSRDGAFQFWERGFDEVTIISEKVFLAKLDYIHNNPVKAGLAEDAANYKYSSVKQYLMGEN